MPPILLVEVDPLGRIVVAARRRWEEHVRPEHAEVADEPDAVRATIDQPDEIRRDAKRGNRENYYRVGVLPPPYHRLYLKVCVEFGPKDTMGREAVGMVVTAYPVNRPKRGEAHLWP